MTDDYTLNRDRIEAVFGDRACEVLAYLSALSDNPWHSAAAREQARAWIAER